MNFKLFPLIFILALGIESYLCAPATDATPTPYTPFDERNVDQLVDYILKTTIHKFDAKLSLIESRLQHFLEALDMLIEETSSHDDKERVKLYTDIRQSTAESLKAIQNETATCGLYLVAMSTLSHITKTVADAKDSQLWNYWTLSNIDEKTLFISSGYPRDNVNEYREAVKYFEENANLSNEAKTKALDFVHSNCQKYEEFAGNMAISN